MSTNLTCVYGIGRLGKTKEYSCYTSNFLVPLNKQLQNQVPLITSITLSVNSSSFKRKLFSIYVGKELNLNSINDYYIEKYDLDQEELEKFRDAGYGRVCLLNYKKYDTFLIGLKSRDRVVPDYYALKRKLDQLIKWQEKGLEIIVQ